MNKVFDEVDINPAFKFKELLNLSSLAVDYTIRHPETQALLRSGKTFDLVISEQAINEALLGIKFNIK